MSFLYLVTIGLLILLFIGMLPLMNRFKNIKITNIVFVSVIFACYLIMVILGYIHNGLYDWNFHILLPTANVSPFMFFVTPLYLILPKDIRKYFGFTVYKLNSIIGKKCMVGQVPVIGNNRSIICVKISDKA